MTTLTPYTLYSCPCTDISTHPDAQQFRGGIGAKQEDSAEQEEQSFNPHSPRASYALYPLEHLLFCNECHELRCQRCYFEEVLYYYCPSCLFETQSNVVKTETNRCTRSCFQCPICFAPLGVSGFPTRTGDGEDSATSKDGSFILSCPYCSWTSYDIGITFEKSLNISGQLSKLYNQRDPLQPSQDTTIKSQATESETEDLFTSSKTQQRDQFSSLAAFYKTQLAETMPAGPLGLGHSFGLDSPGQLSRLLSNYGVGGLRKQKGKIPVMRETLASGEGLRLHDPANDTTLIDNLRSLGLAGTTTTTQRARQAENPRLLSDLRPIPTQLRAKRAKRCRTCRHNLVKPDDKRHSIKHKIKLVALNYIPYTSLRPLYPAAVSLSALSPGKAVQFLLTLRNPLFDPVKVTLASPAATPGPVASSVTVLCPQFEIGANADVWDEALEAGNKDKREGMPAEGQQPEAGKVWERGRNWTTVIIEVTPGAVDQSEDGSGQQLRRDSLEVPVFMRVEYETDDTSAEAYAEGGGKAGRDRKVKREMAFWCVLVVGRIAEP